MNLFKYLVLCVACRFIAEILIQSDVGDDQSGKKHGPSRGTDEELHRNGRWNSDLKVVKPRFEIRSPEQVGKPGRICCWLGESRIKTVPLEEFRIVVFIAVEKALVSGWYGDIS